MKFEKLLRIRLDLFDGGASGASGAGAGTATGGATDAGSAASGAGETQAGSGSTHRGISGETNAQTATAGSEAQSSDAGSDDQGALAPDTPEARRQSFRELVQSEQYKDIYAEEVQRIINDRFKQTKGLEQQIAKTQPLVDMLSQLYGVPDGDLSKLQTAIEGDNAFWSAQAEAAGMDVDAFRSQQKMQAENLRLRRENEAFNAERERAINRQQAERQIQRWNDEAAAVKEIYPNFDLATEAKDRQFIAMLRSGVPVRTAYEVRHMDEIKAGVAAAQAKTTEKQVVDGIRAKGARPQENGVSARSGFTSKEDLSKLTKEQRADLVRRAEMGEKILFSDLLG